MTDADLLELLEKPNSIETAVVNGNGHLLLGFTDGSVVDVGNVVGPAGATGQRGATGLVGDAGRDGAAVLSGPRAPTQDDGKEGDHWIDISSAEFGFYKRSGNGWSKLANLRQPARDPRVGPIAGGGGSGSNNSGGTLQNTSTLPLSGLGTRKTVDAPGGVIVEEKKGLTNQAGVNNWVQAALMAIDESVPVAVVDALPALGNYEGELVFADGSLNIWAKGDWVEVGSGAGKESEPFIEIDQFTVSTAYGYRYNPIFNVNANAEYTWEYQINLDPSSDPNGWGDVADLDKAIQDKIGWYNYETWMELRLNDVGQKNTYPKAEMRFRIWSKLNDKENELCSCPLPAWEDGECDPVQSYEDAWIKERFAVNTEQITWLQNEIRDANVEIKKGRLDQVTLNAEVKDLDSKIDRVESDLTAKIDELEPEASYDDSDLREKLEQEKAFRVEGDQANKDAFEEALSIEAGERKRTDINLQNQIDNLEPADPYDDSDIREKLEQEKAFRVQGDEANNAAIESLTTQAENLRQADEVEKAARIADDAKISAALVEEARIRGDEDYKLLARINGLEIPEMPGDYDDSGLRELIENESALRITGDAALNAKIDLSEDKINAVDQKVEQEKALRVAGDADLEQKVKLEKEARERGDSDLLARIDELETAEGGVDPETFAADQKRQDDAQGAERAARVENDLKLAKELEDYKEEVKAEQEAQDDVAADHTTRIEALEAVPPGSGAEYLNDLKDVDLNPVRSAAGVLESTFLWLHYMNNPGPGELGINGMNLVINKVSYSPSNDPQELIDKIKPGVTVNLKGVIEGAQQNEDIVVQSIVSRRDTYEIEFATVSAYVRKLFELGHESQGVVLEFSYVDVAVIDPGPGPTPPTPTPPVTSGMFLGYDENKALWVPKTLDVSGGGVTDLSNYYLKTETYSQTEVDDLIKDIDVSVNLDDYYTKAEIDAFENAQDARLDALELNSGSGGGGSVDLSGYYKKSETYSKTEVDDLIADVDVNLDDVYTKSEIDSKNYALTQAYLAGDVALQNQIDDLKGQSPDSAITDLNAKVEINKTAIQHVNEDIKNINDDQKTQNDNIAALEGVVAVGLANRYTKDEVYAKDEVYTKDEVDEKIEAVETNGLVKDAENKVTTDFRIMDSENGDTYISTHDHELGLHNLKEPEMSHHAASKGYADDHDQETLESANTYTDDKLGDYYTKAEVDDSQKEQDDATKELEDAAAILNAQVDQNASDIAVLDATAATNLNDLQDVQLTPPTRSTRELKDRDGGGSEDLLHTNTWETYRAYGVSLEQYQWTLQAGVLQMHETNRVPIEWDDFVAKLLPGNKLHVQIKAGPLRSVTARYEISQGKVDSGVVLIQFTEEPTLLSDFTASARDNDDYQLVVSYSEVTVEPPAEPEEPTKRSDIILGYDADTKLWTPHKADYLPLDGGTVKSAINFRAGDKDYDQFSISPNGQNDYATNFYQRNGAQFRIRTTPDKNANQNYKTHFVVGQPQGGKPETKISWLVEPTSSHHAANKEYVDKQVYTPPGLKFTYQSNISSVDEGKFAYDDSNKRLRLSTKSHHVDFSNTLVEDVNQSGLTWTFTIWHQDANGKWYIRVTGKLHRIDFHSDDLLCYVDLHYKHSSFAVDASYWITIAGLF